MKNKKTIDVSIIILSYNTRDLLRTCLEKVYESFFGEYSVEVIVSDNASTDESIKMLQSEFPQVILIQNATNIGYAAGNNKGIQIAKGRYIVLLNSDTEVQRDTFFVMLQYMDAHTDVGVSTCKVLLPSGELDPSCHRGFPTPWAALTYISKLEALFPTSKIFGQYHQGYKGFDTTHEVDCIVGAFFLVRREVVKKVGLLDEDYFMYAEDIDWCYRIKNAGYTILFHPQTSILHRKKQSGRSHNSRRNRLKTEEYFHRYNWLFYTKHYKKIYPWWITMFINDFYTIRLFLLEKIGI